MKDPGRKIHMRIADSEDLQSLNFSSIAVTGLARYDVIFSIDNGGESVSSDTANAQIMLLDLDYHGIDAACLVVEQLKDLRVIVLANAFHSDHLNRLQSLGGRGFCLKDPSPQRLYSAMLAVSGGDTWIDGGIIFSVDAQAEEAAHREPIAMFSSPSPTMDKLILTDRERQILPMIMEGATNREIASRLFLSVSTIKSTVHRLVEKLEAKDRTQAAVHAAQRGFI